MRSFLLLVVICVMSGHIHAEQAVTPPPATVIQQVDDERSQIDTLMKATQASLERQKQVREFIVNYKNIEKACVGKPNDSALLNQLAKAGKQTYEAIDENGLTDYFRPEFIRDLQKLKQIADKKTISAAR